VPLKKTIVVTEMFIPCLLIRRKLKFDVLQEQ